MLLVQTNLVFVRQTKCVPLYKMLCLKGSNILYAYYCSVCCRQEEVSVKQTDQLYSECMHMKVFHLSVLHVSALLFANVQNLPNHRQGQNVLKKRNPLS